MTGASREGVVPADAAPRGGADVDVAPASADAATMVDAGFAQPEPELGIVGRLLVGAIVVAGLAVGAISGIGLYWFVPFGGVGALLVIRRPRNSIGWILLALAWVLVVLILPINATVEAFPDELPPEVFLPTALMIVAQSLIILLIGSLAFVVPSGRLPTGHWGTIARVVLGAAIVVEALAIVAPTINVTLPDHPNGALVPNPLALAPELPLWTFYPRELAFAFLLALLVVSAASLIHRFHRSRGIERQQLRWIGASLTLLVVTFLLGVAIPALFPVAEADATLPVVVAMSTVPLAIGVAVMRYRLYEIDTIINRAIVYGMLTAVLAGASAAVIGLTQTLFVGILGPGSTVTIVLTTMLVVATFTPIKTRLQAIVDRRFKPAPDPAATLHAFVVDVRDGISRPDRDRSFRRLLDLAVPELATAAEIRWTGHGDVDGTASAGAEVGTLPVAIAVSHGTETAEIRLAGVRTSRAEVPLREALLAVLVETEARPATA